MIGEQVVSDSGIGKVDSWNNRIELLKVSTSRDFKVGDLVEGQTSGTKGTVKSKIDYNSEMKLSPLRLLKKDGTKLLDSSMIISREFLITSIIKLLIRYQV